MNCFFHFLKTSWLHVLFLFLTTPAASFSQHSVQQKKLFVYNIGLGAVIACIGSVINKPAAENWKIAAISGFWQGATGGILQNFGKQTIYLVNKKHNLFYSWPSKFLNDAGTSIIANAAGHKVFLQNWNTNLGAIRLDYSFATKQIRARFLPMAVYSMIAGFQAAKLDINTALATGYIVFKTKDSVLNISGPSSSGVSYGRAFAYVDDGDKYHYISHEIIHQYQFDQYQSINLLFNPLSNKIKFLRDNKVFRYIYPDIPYFWIAYGIEGKHDLNFYYKNFYEFEAESYSTNRFIKTR